LQQPLELTAAAPAPFAPPTRLRSQNTIDIGSEVILENGRALESDKKIMTKESNNADAGRAQNFFGF